MPSRAQGSLQRTKVFWQALWLHFTRHPRVLLWAPNLDPNTYQLHTIYQREAHRTHPTRIKRAPSYPESFVFAGMPAYHAVLVLLYFGVCGLRVQARQGNLTAAALRNLLASVSLSLDHYLDHFFHIYIYVYINIHVYIHMYICIYVHGFLQACTYIYIYACTYQSFYPFIYLSIHLSIYPSTYLFIHLSICSSMYLSLWLLALTIIYWRVQAGSVLVWVFPDELMMAPVNQLYGAKDYKLDKSSLFRRSPVCCCIT